MGTSFRLFDTAIGVGGIAWDGERIVGVQLPESSAGHVRERLKTRFGAVEADPPASIQEVIGRIQRLLQGERVDLTDIELDMERVPELPRRVYEIARQIPAGKTLTYGQIAAQLGDDPRLAIDVGQALSRNPFPIIVPCHRVTAAKGKLGGFSARGGVATKQRLLEIEQAAVAWQLPLA